MTDNEELLLDELDQKSSALGIDLDGGQRSAIKAFCLGIIEYSSHTNLVGKAEFPVLIREHVLDSLSLVSHLVETNAKKGTCRLVDVGSGAGFPAMILSIAVPTLKATLIEASGKKCRFLLETVQSLKMQDRVTILAARAEELGHEPAHRNKYDWGTARAVGTFDLSAELVMPFLSVGGRFIAQKSLSQKDDELRRAQLCLPKLGGKLSEVCELDLNTSGKPRMLMVAEKMENTPSIYPRVWSKIKSRPLGV
jgi:16S rRNA (guanine527-N7)-methyltransferase